MKKSAILKILQGEVNFLEVIPPRNQEISDGIDTIVDKLREKLSGEMMHMVNDLVDLLKSENNTDTDFCIVQAFKLGLNLGMECKE